jgi:hypothetical protein
VWRSAVVVAAALTFGVLTAYAQGWLPQPMGSLANSAGSWALVACALSLLATSDRLAAVFGCVSLLGLLAGYVLGAQMLGYPSSHTTIVFWSVAALLAGPPLGLGARWVKTRRDLLAAIGVGVLSGVLVGEGLYGLTRIADTTYPPYWWGEILVGLALLLAVAWRRLHGVRTVQSNVALTLVLAQTFVVA